MPTDFTKQYNRMRQHQTALAGSGSGSGMGSGVPLPARNAGRQRKASAPDGGAASGTAAQSNAGRKLAPLASGVPSAPKAAYTKANTKDKADRATQEQVLDPRTKAVLASLVRKGLVRDVGGCVSTGKEVGGGGCGIELGRVIPM